MTDNPIPPHHIQWFENLTRAFANGDVALMSCLDAKTGEPRSVICMVQQEESGKVQFTPVGHLCSEPNPYDAYIPLETTENEEGEPIRQIRKRTLN